jgi:hypothetical protein
MQSSRGGRYLLTMLVAVGCQGRDFGAKLVGDELLIEVERIAPGTEPPGIYAYKEETGASCVVPMGRRPRWSPSHRSIACELAGQTAVISIREGTLTALPTIQAFTLAAVPVPTPMASPAVLWLPDEAAVVRWSEVGGRSAVLVDARNRDLPPRVLAEGGEQAIGRISFSVDGVRLAYEQFALVPDVGAVGRTVVIANRAEKTRSTLRSPVLDPGVLLNPLWRPNGDHLAVDWITPTHTRRSAIIDTRTFGARLIEPPGEGDAWSQVCAWSPDGTRLLLAIGDSHGRGARLLHVASVAADGAPQITHFIGGPAFVHACAWSPNGVLVALLMGFSSALDTDRSPAVFLWSPAKGRQRGPVFPPHLKPVGIDW